MQLRNNWKFFLCFFFWNSFAMSYNYLKEWHFHYLLSYLLMDFFFALGKPFFLSFILVYLVLIFFYLFFSKTLCPLLLVMFLCISFVHIFFFFKRQNHFNSLLEGWKESTVFFCIKIRMANYAQWIKFWI